MAKILVLVGSPRKNGNTDRLADAFIRGASQQNNTIVKFNIADYKINGCLGCDYCRRNNGKCVQNDDMNLIYENLYNSDVLVLASPIYYYAITAQIKAVIDRFYAGLDKPFNISSSILLLAYASEDDDDSKAAVMHYNVIADALKLENKGIVLAGNVWDKGDIEGHDALIQAEELGKNII